MKVFSKILIANRGEIARRIIRTLKEMDIIAVVVYSYHDRNELFVSEADEAYLLNGKGLADTYLDIEQIIRIAEESQCEAIHPGYGFLSENASFAEAAARQGINFIGPDPGVIRIMGEKDKARDLAIESGIPVAEGLRGNTSFLIEESGSLSLPLLVKASAGGGGKAMRIIREREKLPEAIGSASNEALNYFGNPELILEKYLEGVRHIEIQILADHYGKCIVLGERECSVQRRHQKVIEEAPVISLKENTKARLWKYSIELCNKIRYTGAGTLEFLVDDMDNIYFLEMNTRIQVEHAVTELVTTLDIVRMQILIAAGNPLELDQEDVKSVGHAIEARLYAEDPASSFLPSPGTISFYKEPVMKGLRIDSGYAGAGEIRPEYDPLIAKLIFKGGDRGEAIQSLKKAVLNFRISGIKTNREFIHSVLSHKDFEKNRIHTSWLEEKREDLLNNLENEKMKTDRDLLLISWMIKKLSKDHRIQGSLWQKLGKWRQFAHWQLIFHGENIKIFIGRNSDTEILLKINGNPFKVTDFSSINEKVRFSINGKTYNSVVISGQAKEDRIIFNGYEYSIRSFDYLPDEPWIEEKEASIVKGPKLVRSPLYGKIIKIRAEKGMKVEKGDTLLSLDAMKIENRITAPCGGTVKKIFINEGDQVRTDQNLVEIEELN